MSFSGRRSSSRPAKTARVSNTLGASHGSSSVGHAAQQTVTLSDTHPSLRDAINTNLAKVGVTATQIQTINDAAALASDVGTLQTDLGTATSTLATLGTSLSTAEHAIISAESDITTAQTDITNLQTGKQNLLNDTVDVTVRSIKVKRLSGNVSTGTCYVRLNHTIDSNSYDLNASEATPTYIPWHHATAQLDSDHYELVDGPATGNKKAIKFLTAGIYEVAFHLIARSDDADANPMVGIFYQTNLTTTPGANVCLQGTFSYVPGNNLSLGARYAVFQQGPIQFYAAAASGIRIGGIRTYTGPNAPQTGTGGVFVKKYFSGNNGNAAVNLVANSYVFVRKITG